LYLLSGSTLRQLRLVHTWLGSFFAPAILFFAFTGALQTFSLHESHGDSAYRPPAWIVTISSIHKDQTLPRPRRAHAETEGPPPHAETHKAEPGPKDEPGAKTEFGYRVSVLLLKLFVLSLATGLILSTLIGVTLALTNRASRRTTLILLVLGALVPLVILFF
jgi:hypothetical protein